MKVSIITPTYNSESTIRRTINSVLSQSYNNVEYIVVDGNSTDSTLLILNSFQQEFKKKGYSYRFISEPDKGISDAFNKGIRLSTGELIGIINSDDWLGADAIQNIVEGVDDSHVAFCGDLNLFSSVGKFIKRRQSKPLLLPFGMYVMHPTVFIKRHVYERHLFDEKLRYVMDYDLMLRVRRDYRNAFKYIPFVIANMSGGGVSGDVLSVRNEERHVLYRYFSRVHLLFLMWIRKYALALVDMKKKTLNQFIK